MSKLPEMYDSFLDRKGIGCGNLCIAQGKNVLSRNWDFDVWLPTKNMNLQRSLVWSLDQKRSLIESVIIRRSIPPISVIQLMNDTYQVIDGKQRLSTIIQYIAGEFDFCGYLFDDLPREYLLQIKRHFITAYRLCERETPVTDDEKIEWFKWINFAGTLQDMDHMNKLSSC